MTRSRVKSVHEDVIKPPGDKRSYRGLLLQNEMKVMLISDPTTDKSSAALQVGVGMLQFRVKERQKLRKYVDKSRYEFIKQLSMS